MFGRQSGGCGDTRARKPMLSQAIHNNGEGLKGGFVVYLSKRHVRIIFCDVVEGIHKTVLPRPCITSQETPANTTSHRLYSNKLWADKTPIIGQTSCARNNANTIQ